MANLIKMNLDTVRNNYETLELMQGYTYNFQFEIVRSGKTINLEGATPRLDLARGDGTYVIQTDNIEMDKGVINGKVNNSFTSSSGRGGIQLILTKGNEIFGSWVIACNIKRRAIEGLIEEDDVVTILEELDAKIVEATEVKKDTEKLVENGGAAAKSDLVETNLQLEKKAKKSINKSIFTKNKFGGGLQCKQAGLIGDSISYGLSVSDISNDSYAGILRKMFQTQFNTKNYGLVSLIDKVSDSNGTYNTIYKKTVTGGWSDGTQDNHFNRHCLQSVNNGATMEFMVPTITKGFNIVIDKNIGGGVLEVQINNVTVGEIDTNDNILKLDQLSDFYSFNSNLNNNTIKLIKKDSGLTTITGIMYMDSFQEYCFNLMARSGKKLLDLDNIVLDKVCDSNILIMALGHNDMAGGINNLVGFTNKINYIINKCNLNKTFVVVPDFCWYRENNTQIKFKNELKRLADETNGIYIDFADLLKSNNSQDWIKAGLLADWSHPTAHGHQVIAEIIASEIELFKNSKDAVMGGGVVNIKPLEEKVAVIEKKINKTTQYHEGTGGVPVTLRMDISLFLLKIQDGASVVEITIPNSMNNDGGTFDFSLQKWDAAIVKFKKENGTYIVPLEIGAGKNNGWYKFIYLSSVGEFRKIKVSDDYL